MVAKLAKKLQVLLVDFVENLSSKVDEDNYGLNSCKPNYLSELDGNPKYQKIKKDFITHYNKYNEHQINALKNQCDVLNIINRL